MKASKSIITTFAATTLVTLLAYTNCGRFEANVMGVASGSPFKVGEISSGSTCDEALVKTFESGFHGFFRQESTCLRCHVEGGQGIGTFASADIGVSLAAFTAAGLSKISYMATSPQHKPPYTGIQNKPAIDALSAQWTEVEREHLACVSRTQFGENASILTAPKSAPQIYGTANGKQTLTWDLESSLDLDASTPRAVPAKISIDVSILYHNVDGKPVAQGYIFSNPVLQLKNPTDAVVIEGLMFQINGLPISSQTTFSSISRVVSGETPIPLMLGNANTLMAPLSTSDEFQLYIRRLSTTASPEGAVPPLTPTLRIGSSTTGSVEFSNSRDVSVFILRDAGIVRWCLSESPIKPKNTEAPCDRSDAPPGSINGWVLKRPTTFRLSEGDGPKRLYLWVANDSLLLNAEPAEATVSLDTTPPEPAQITSIASSRTQVAEMSVSHPNSTDVAGWCVFEQRAFDPSSAPTPTDRCWFWTDYNEKPTTVGYKEGGDRAVTIYVRDKAGNVSRASNRVVVNNPYDRISLDTLWGGLGFNADGTRIYGDSSNPQAVFARHCIECHDSRTEGQGYRRLDLSNYAAASASALAGTLVSRTNNPLSPMPNVSGGLISKKERDLIRLWAENPIEGR